MLSRAKASCTLCGLPVRTPAGHSGESLFCCYACRLVTGIIGPQENGAAAWNLTRLSVGALLAMNIMMISLLFYGGGVEPYLVPLFRWLLLVLAIPALLLLLAPFLGDAFRRMGGSGPGMDTLIALGSLTAFFVSAVNTIRGQGEIFYDTATMLPALVTVGKVIETEAKRRAGDLLHSLETLLPATALRLSPEGVVQVPIDQLTRGDLLRVLPGDRIPVDGVIREGGTLIAEAPFTGEFLPRYRTAGDRVMAGTVNGAGSLVVETIAAGEEVLLQRIIAMIDSAWRLPAASERIAQRAAAFFIPAVVILAVGTLLFWAAGGDSAKGWLSALSVLVVACPCTIGIATPLATSLAISRAAREGIIVRGGDAMERLGLTEELFFDKTGTVTTDTPILTEIICLDPGMDNNVLLGLAAGLESASEHPVARAIVTAARERGLPSGIPTEIQVTPGKGISGRVQWQDHLADLRVGSAAFAAGEPDDMGHSCGIVHVAWGGKIRGLLLLRETIRGDAAESVRLLHGLGITTNLLSGDSYEAASAIGREAGIGRILASLDPEEKLKTVLSARGAGRMVAMVGDGINDAPALAAAPTGIAVTGGMALARQAGNVVLLSDRLVHIPWLITLSRRARSIIRQNFAWSFGYNAVALGTASAGLLHPLIAAVAMVLSSLTVLTSSLRLRNFPSPGVARIAPTGAEEKLHMQQAP